MSTGKLQDNTPFFIIKHENLSFNGPNEASPFSMEGRVGCTLNFQHLRDNSVGDSCQERGFGQTECLGQAHSVYFPILGLVARNLLYIVPVN